MRYDNDAALAEITRRSEELKRRKSAGTTALLTAVSGTLVLALCFVFSLFVHPSSAGIVFEQYGALMLDEQAGSYVLTAVAGFAAACGLTVGISRHNEKK